MSERDNRIKMAIGCIALPLLVSGCQSPSGVKASFVPSASPLSDQTLPLTNPKRPAPFEAFVPGPAIKPSSRLLNWLEHEAQNDSRRRRIRLPVVIQFQDSYRLALGDSFIGAYDAERDGDVIHLVLNDAAMGVALLSVLKDECPKAENACAVWLEGYWGAMSEPRLPEVIVPNREAQRRGARFPFTVLKVHEVIQGRSGPDVEMRVFLASP